MTELQALLESGQLLDLIIVLIGAETLLVLLLGVRRGKVGITLRLIPNLLAGALLMFAIRLSVTDGTANQILSVLAAIFAAHLTDLYIRLKPVVCKD